MSHNLNSLKGGYIGDYIRDYYRVIKGDIGGTISILGVPILRIMVYWGLHWVPLILGNYQIAQYGFRV